MRLFRTLIFLIFLMSPSFGDEVNDVGLICESDNYGEVNNHISVWLKENGKLERYDRDVDDLDKDGNYTEFFRNDFHSQFIRHTSTDTHILISYYISENEIDPQRRTHINRFDLKMTDDLFGKEYKYDCKVFSDKNSFFDGIKDIENEIKKILNKRKI